MISLNLTWVLSLIIILAAIAGIAFTAICGISWLGSMIAGLGRGILSAIKMIFLRKE